MPASTDPLLRQFLADHHARCPACGHDLHHNSQSACPECGTTVRLALGVAAPTLLEFWRIAGALGSGASLLFVFIMLLSFTEALASTMQSPFNLQLVARGMAPAGSLPEWRVLIMFVLMAIAACAALAFCVTGRRAFAHMTRTQRILVGLVLLVSPAWVLLACRLYLAWVA